MSKGLFEHVRTARRFVSSLLLKHWILSRIKVDIVDFPWLEHLWYHVLYSRHGFFEPPKVNHNTRSEGKWGYFRNVFSIFYKTMVQSNFNGSNIDDSFTMAYSNSFLSPYGIFPIAPENK